MPSNKSISNQAIADLLLIRVKTMKLSTVFWQIMMDEDEDPETDVPLTDELEGAGIRF